LVQLIEPLEGIDPLSEIDPLAWDLGEDDVESLVLDDDVVAALWDIGESNSFERREPLTAQSPATPTEQVPETKSPVEEVVEPKDSDSQKKEVQQAVSDEIKTDNGKEEDGGDKEEESSTDPQQKEGNDGLPSYLYCQPIATDRGVDLPPPQEDILEETKESSTLNREQLLDELAGLGLDSLAQLALYSDQLKGMDQDNLLSILEEATGLGQGEQNLLDLDGEDLFAELNDLGFGGLAEIAKEAFDEPLLICQPCAPTPTVPTIFTKEGEKGESIKPASDTKAETKQEPESESTKPPAVKEETEGVESSNSPAGKNGDWTKDKSKIEERIRIQQLKLDVALNPDKMEGMPLQIADAQGSDSSPRIVELEEEIDGKPRARSSDGPSQPAKKPRPITSGPTTSVREEQVEQEKMEKEKRAVEKEKTQNEEAKAAESVAQQAALRITSQMFTPGRTISVKDDLEKAKSQKQEESKPATSAQQPQTQPAAKGAASKNEAFLARLRGKEAEAKKRKQRMKFSKSHRCTSQMPSPAACPVSLQTFALFPRRKQKRH